jgi:glycine/D-amino acid oxidase-like deaminating enzyme
MSGVTTPKGASVIIVGAGVTGLSAAWWLARAGVDVLVIDKGVVGWEASGRNGGGCTHHQSPLFAEEQRLWPMMDELLGYPTEFQPRRLRIALTDRQLETMKRGVDNTCAQGFPAEWLDAAQVREMAPLTGDTVVAGAYFACGGHANPQRTVQAYAWALHDLGGVVLQGVAVTGFALSSGKVRAVKTAMGEFVCEQVVIAAGPQTGVLSAMLETEVPVAPARAEMIVTEPLPLMPMGGIDGNGLYGRQTMRGNLAYGGGPHEWLPASGTGSEAMKPSSPIARNVAKRLAELFPKAAHVRVIRTWAGIIENTPDGRPVIDRLPSVDNVTVATMSSVGFGLSPASGRAIAEIVTEGRCSFADLSTFRLSRFGNLAPGWRERKGWLPPESVTVHVDAA